MLPLDRAYDGIIIGAGQHGLVLANYMASQGLKVLLVDRRLKYGGGMCTEESTLPGFYHNLHSINHYNISNTPWFADLGLADKVEYITPRYEFAQPHLDGSCLVFGRDLDETCANIARFSARDAATFREWNTRAEKMTRDIFMAERFSEPLGQAQREALLSRTAMGREFLEVTRRQPLEVVEELFENEHVRLLFLFKLSLFGTWLTDTLSKTSPMGSVIRAFDLESGYQLCKGGSFNLARGLMERFLEAGGTYQPQVSINRVILEGGRATGIETTDGKTVRASQFVVSTLDVHQTYEDLIGRDQLPAHFLEKLDRFQYTSWTLFGVHYALAENPRFYSEAFDPNIAITQKWSIGAETMDDLISAMKDVEEGKIPKVIQFGSGGLSAVDPSLAPPGRGNTYAWHIMPESPDLSDRGNDYALFKEEFADAILDKWALYCPNMTKEHVLGRFIYTAREYTLDLPNMRHGDILMGALNAEQVMYNNFGYRSPIPNFYMAGSAGHPGGGMSGGAGYISAGIIADDLELKHWWKPWRAAELLQQLRD